MMMRAQEDREARFERIEYWLTVAFYILAASCLVAFFTLRHEARWAFISLGIAALLVRLCSYILRLIKH